MWINLISSIVTFSSSLLTIPRNSLQGPSCLRRCNCVNCAHPRPANAHEYRSTKASLCITLCMSWTCAEGKRKKERKKAKDCFTGSAVLSTEALSGYNHEPFASQQLEEK